MRRLAAISLFLGLAPTCLLAIQKDYLWQDGELTSRRTVVHGRNQQRHYIYRVRGARVRYLVMAEQPLNLNLRSQMKFSAERRRLVIQDADGQERRMTLLEERRAPLFRR